MPENVSIEENKPKPSFEVRAREETIDDYTYSLLFQPLTENHAFRDHHNISNNLSTNYILFGKTSYLDLTVAQYRMAFKDADFNADINVRENRGSLAAQYTRVFEKLGMKDELTNLHQQIIDEKDVEKSEEYLDQLRTKIFASMHQKFADVITFKPGTNLEEVTESLQVQHNEYIQKLLNEFQSLSSSSSSDITIAEADHLRGILSREIRVGASFAHELNHVKQFIQEGVPLAEVQIGYLPVQYSTSGARGLQMWVFAENNLDRAALARVATSPGNEEGGYLSIRDVRLSETKTIDKQIYDS
jgi:hypothetical protein